MTGVDCVIKRDGYKQKIHLCYKHIRGISIICSKNIRGISNICSKNISGISIICSKNIRGISNRYILKSQQSPTRKVFVYKIQVNSIHTILKCGDYYDFMDR